MDPGPDDPAGEGRPGAVGLIAVATSRNWDRSPESAKDKKFHDLRASGYKGPIDQDGDRARVVGKGLHLRIVKVK